MVVAWQPSLLGGVEPGFDASYDGLDRWELSSGAWLDVVPGWVEGADALFASVLDTAPWAGHERRMYDRIVAEPRLTTREWADPPTPVPQMAEALAERYDVDLRVISANLYRDGRDSVAWHGDRVGRRRPGVAASAKPRPHAGGGGVGQETTVVAIVSLGEPRRFLLRPKGGGRSLRLLPAAGDLLVLGGTIQRTWEHSVPKVARAGPRISVMFRQSY